MNNIQSAVLLSTKPRWSSLIASGVKRIEVRRTAPKLETPFECYIYCTKDRYNHLYDLRKVSNGDLKLSVVQHNKSSLVAGGFLNGKVIGEFVCDRVEKIEPCLEYYSDGYDLDDDTLTDTCLTREELMLYGKGMTLYGWHISDVKIYDKPKELREFKRCYDYRCVEGLSCKFYEWVEWYKSMDCMRSKTVTRPPQSWCYVEKL